MGAKSTTLIRIALVVLALGVALELSDAARMVLASPEYELERQTVPSRTPTPEPPPPTDTPAPPPPTDTPAPPPPTQPPGTVTLTPAEPSQTPTETAPPPTLTVDTDSDVYGGPGVEFDVVGFLRAGQTAVVVGRNVDNSWWQIIYRSDTAWIPDTVVTVSRAAYFVPVVNVSAPGTTTPIPSRLPTAGGNAWLLSGGALLLLFGAVLILAGRNARRRPM